MTEKTAADLLAKVKETEKLVREARDRVVVEAFEKGIAYNCVWCGHCIDPKDFKTLKEFKNACSRHSDSHATEMTEVETNTCEE